jgi:hypothetical protein
VKLGELEPDPARRTITRYGSVGLPAESAALCFPCASQWWPRSRVNTTKLSKISMISRMPAAAWTTGRPRPGAGAIIAVAVATSYVRPRSVELISAGLRLPSTAAGRVAQSMGWSSPWAVKAVKAVNFACGPAAGRRCSNRNGVLWVKLSTLSTFDLGMSTFGV